MSLVSDIFIREYPNRSVPRQLATLVLRSLLFFLIFLAAGSQLISPRLEETGVSVFYVPIAILIYLFFISRSWQLNLRVATIFLLAALSWTYFNGHSLSGSLPYVLIDMAEAGTLAWVLRNYGTRGLRLRRPYRVTLFLGVSFSVTALYALFAASVSTLGLGSAVITSTNMPLVWRDWVFGDFTVYVSILAALLLLRGQSRRQATEMIQKRWAEFGAAVVFLSIAVLYDFQVIQAIFGGADRNFDVSSTPNAALVLIIVPAILWISYRFRQLGAATGIIIISIPSIHLVAFGFGPGWLTNSPDRVQLLQAYVCCTAIASLYVAALAHQVKHREFLLKRALWFARKRSRDRADFLATFSHELRTPLNGILGFTQIMMGSEGGELSGRHREFIDMIDQSSKQLLDMVTEVLSMQRMRQDAFALHMEQLRPVDVAQEVIGMVSGIAQREGIIIKNSIPESLQLTANERGLRLMLSNLISNALLYTQAGGYIEVSGNMDSKRCWLSVSDNGPGFDIGKIMGNARLADGGKRKGLGLQVVDTIVALHDGRMSIKSKTDGLSRGTKVWLSFPRMVGGRNVAELSSTRDAANDRMRSSN